MQMLHAKLYKPSFSRDPWAGLIAQPKRETAHMEPSRNFHYSRDESVQQDGVPQDRVRMQIEYYFSEENLRSDRYLRSQMAPGGWVSLALVAEFKRLVLLDI